jgi:hypothetical protein
MCYGAILRHNPVDIIVTGLQVVLEEQPGQEGNV